jgi:hypothetical protein
MWYRFSNRPKDAKIDFEIREYQDGDDVIQVRFWSRSKKGKSFLEEHCAELKPTCLPYGEQFVKFICEKAGEEKLNYTTIRD